jgi:hypothetical protein
MGAERRVRGAESVGTAANRLEIAGQGADHLPMTNPTNRARDEMLADLDAELFVPGEVVRQDLLDSLARMKAKFSRRHRLETVVKQTVLV